MRIEDLTDDQIARAKECKSTEELIALARGTGVELSDEQLDAFAGGSLDWNCESECYEEIVKNCTDLC